MKLLLDLGNSCLKWALATRGRIAEQGALDCQDALWPEALAPLQKLNVSPDEIRIANVAGPERGRGLVAALKVRFHAPIVQASSPAAGAGVRNGYRDPVQLGVDRWLALCAAYAGGTGGPACVVDAGTATTLDVVLADGTHRGGLIVPGLGLMEAALLQRTGDLNRLTRQREQAQPARDDSPGTRRLGRDTAEAIRLGALEATAGLMDACMASLVEEFPDRVRLVLTGGNAPRLLPVLKGPAEYRPTLVLEGLALEPPCFANAG